MLISNVYLKSLCNLRDQDDYCIEMRRRETQRRTPMASLEKIDRCSISRWTRSIVDEVQSLPANPDTISCSARSREKTFDFHPQLQRLVSPSAHCFSLASDKIAAYEYRSSLRISPLCPTRQRLDRPPLSTADSIGRAVRRPVEGTARGICTK